MYVTALYSGEYHRLITCDGCGDLLVIGQRIFNAYGQSQYVVARHGIGGPLNHFCSSACKWEYSYRVACSVPGVRPIAPMGSWGWACRKAREMNASGLCAVCQEPVTEWRTIQFRKKDGPIYYCVELGPTEYHHKKPLYLGGTSLPENLEVLHPKCHRRRHRRMPGRGNHQRKKRVEAEASQEVLDHFL